jgi:ABC-type branched-subunit amino acid transport system substrate-binding protein
MQDATRDRRRRGRTARVLALLVLPSAFGLAACGSGGDDNSAGLSGKPIKIMTIAPVETTGVSFPIFADVAKVFEKWVNDKGGIDGRPVQVIFCDDQGTPTKASDCARKAVSEKVVAVVGGFTFQGDSIVPILEAAKTSWFGGLYAISPLENTSPNVQVIGSGFATYTANGVSPGVDGCKKTVVFTYEGANGDEITEAVSNGLHSVGAPPVFKTVLVPPSVQDYAPQLEQATDGSDCIVASLGSVSFPPFFTAFKATGGKQRIYAQAGNLFDDMVKSFAPETQNLVIAGSFGNITSPAWADFRDALEKYNAPGAVSNYNGTAGLGAWAGYLAFQQVVESMSGDITAENFLAAAQKAKIDLPGKVAPVDMSDRFTQDPNHETQVNRVVSFETVKDGKVLPWQEGKFYDMTEAMLGKTLSPENIPPAVDPPVN